MATADLDAALGGAERVLLDTSTLIAFHNRRELVHPLAVHVLARIGSDGDPLVGYYSVISAAELLVRPLRARPAEHAFMHTFLMGFPHLGVLPVDLPVAMQAATLRAGTNVRPPDALVIASAMLAGCEAIVSNDEEWRRRLSALFREFRWLYLAEYL